MATPALSPKPDIDAIAATLYDRLQQPPLKGVVGVGVGARDDGPELVVYVSKAARLRRGDVPAEYENIPTRVVRIAPIGL